MNGSSHYLQKGNYYEEPYEDFMFINIPLIIVTARNNEGSTEIYIEPSMSEVKDLLYKTFVKIVEVNFDVPRVERFLFEGIF